MEKSSEETAWSSPQNHPTLCHCFSSTLQLGLICRRSFPPGKRKMSPKRATNPSTTEFTLPQLIAELWHKAQSSRPGHKSVKQWQKNLLHFDLSRKGEERTIPSWLQAHFSKGKIEYGAQGIIDIILLQTLQYLLNQIFQTRRSVFLYVVVGRDANLYKIVCIDFI